MWLWIFFAAAVVVLIVSVIVLLFQALQICVSDQGVCNVGGKNPLEKGDGVQAVLIICSHLLSVSSFSSLK